MSTSARWEIVATDCIDFVTTRYVERSPSSAELHRRALSVHPGGDTRSVLSVEPFPVYMASRSGAEVVDVDGNVYLDALNNFTALIHGGRTDHIEPAIAMAVNKGIAFGSPTSLSIELGQVLIDRVPSIDVIRFCNSGTEAVMHAIRAARAFTQRSKVLVFRRGYHGSYDTTSMLDLGQNASSSTELDSVRMGIPHATADQVDIAEFNDLGSAREVAGHTAGDLAAILVEPMQNAAGCLPGSHEFLLGLRDLAYELGALLIFDEVVTLRLSSGGMQEVLGVEPHLTSLGKIIGGGFPIGAFGGAAEIMEAYHPIHGSIKQSGTFNALPLSMSAGLAALEAYKQADIVGLNQLGKQLAQGLENLADRYSDQIDVTGQGSLWNVTWSDEPPADLDRRRDSRQESFYKACMINGLQIAPRGMFALSTAMDSRIVEDILARAGAAMEMVAEID